MKSVPRQVAYQFGVFAFVLVVAMAAFPPAIARAQMNSKWVTVVEADEPITLDGCQMSGQSIGLIVRQNIIETLTELDPVDSKVTPRLATSWERINDTTWRFKLRQGVTFHDGAPFNAQTAAWGIWRSMEKGAELVCTTRSRYFVGLEMTAVPVDEYTLDLVTNKPEPILPTRMSLFGLVSPHTDTTKAVLVPVGTGPYKFLSWKPGTEALIKRNDDYWGDKPAVEGARYVWRGESAVRAAMVKIGEADIAPQIALQDVSDPELDISYPSPETVHIRIEMGRKPFDDIRVRQALNYGFDFNSLSGRVLPKEAMRATQMVAPRIAGHNHDLDKRPFPYDPAKAKQLMAAAKAAGAPIDSEIWLIGRLGLYPNSTEVLEAAMAMWQSIGLSNLKLKVVDQGQWRAFNYPPYSPDRPPLLFNISHDNANGDEVFTVANNFSCGGGQSFVCDPTLEELIKKATGLTGEERAKTWQEAFRVIYEDLVSNVFIHHPVAYMRVSKRVGFKPQRPTNIELPLASISFK